MESDCKPPMLSPCTPDSASTKCSESLKDIDHNDDESINDSVTCGVFDFNTKRRSVSNGSSDTASTATLTAEEDNNIRDSPPLSPESEDISQSLSSVSQERLAQQREQIEQNRALQSLLRNVTFANEEKIQSLRSRDGASFTEASAAVSDVSIDLSLAEARSTMSCPAKLSLKERLQRKIMKTSKKKAQSEEQNMPSGSIVSSDGESLESRGSKSSRRRRRLLKSQDVPATTSEELNTHAQEQDSNMHSDCNGDDTSDILSGYASLDDYYLKSGSISNLMSSFSASSIDADDVTNRTMRSKLPTEEDTLQMRKINIHRHHKHQCNSSRNKAVLDAVLTNTPNSRRTDYGYGDDEASLLDIDNSDDDSNDGSSNQNGSVTSLLPQKKKKAKVTRHEKDQRQCRLPRPTQDRDTMHKKTRATDAKSRKEKIKPKGTSKKVSRSCHASDSESLLRLSRQARFGRRGEVPTPENRVNNIKMHVYDLIARETTMPLPWGCDCPIGKCFSAVNSTLHALGTGAYHVGVEINGIEYAFGANNIEGMSGVFTSVPKMSPGYEFRTTVDFGDRQTIRKSWVSVPKVECIDLVMSHTESFQSTPPPKRADNKRSMSTNDTENINNDELAINLVKSPDWQVVMSEKVSNAMTPMRGNGVSAKSPPLQSRNVPSVYREVETFMDGHSVMVELSREYMGTDYDLLRKNCCTFALDSLLRLGVPRGEIPTWFYNIAEAGAATEDAVKDVDQNVLMPLRRMMSSSALAEDDDKDECLNQEHSPEHHGFEVIAKIKRGSINKTEMEIVRVVESFVGNRECPSGKPSRMSKFSARPSDAELGDNSIGIRHTLSWTY